MSEMQKINLILLKGKAMDMKGDYAGAATVYEENLKNLKELIKKKSISDNSDSKQLMGNIEFRLGWSLIRSRKDVKKGIKHLKESSIKQPKN